MKNLIELKSNNLIGVASYTHKSIQTLSKTTKMNTSNTTPKQKALTWWNNLGNEGIKAMMRKYGIEWHTTKPSMYRVISDKGILNIYLKEHYRIQCSQTANLIEGNLTIEQAKQMVSDWEEQDTAEGIYKPNCYEIVPMFEA